MSVKQGGKTIAGATQYHPDLFDYKRADHIVNDAQWLMADTFSWQYGSMYKVAYAHLATDIDGKTLQSETIFDITIQFYLADDGHKICPASEEDKILSLYNKIGVAWYYIIDTANQRFKLPRESEGNKYHGKIIKTYNDGNKWARLYNDGWVEQGGRTNDGNFLITMANTNYSAIVSPLTMYAGERSVGNIIYRNSVNDVTFGWGNTSSGDLSWEVKGWSVYANNDQYFDGKKYLYFYVGAFTQTSLENIASIATETLNNKMDVGTPLARDIFSPDEWVGGAAENILAAGVGSGTITFTKNWQEYDYLWFSSVSDGSSNYDDSPHWVSVKWLLSRAAAGDTNLAIIRYSSGAYWYVNPQTWTTTTMPVGGGSENLYINRVYAIKLKNITAENVGYLNYVGNFATVVALNATAPTAMGQWAIVDADENHSNLQTKYFSTKNSSGQFIWSYGGIINTSLAGADYVVERQEPTAANNYTWYRKYKSGWVEQGGAIVGLTNWADRTITLPITMRDRGYSYVQSPIMNTSTGPGNWAIGVTLKTETQITSRFYANNGFLPTWQVSGMAAN